MTTLREPRTDVARDVDRLGVLLAIPGFPMLNMAFRSVIEGTRDLRVVGEVADGDDVVAMASGADVVVTECEPFGGSGCSTFESLERLRGACPEVKIIALDCRCAAEQYSVAIKAGAGEATLPAHAGP